MSRRSNSPGHRRSPGWHSATWWTGVGGVATVLAAVLALLAWWFPQSPEASPASPTASAQPRGPLPLTLLQSASSEECGGPGRFYLPQSVDDIPGDVPGEPESWDEADENKHLEAMKAWTSANGGFTQVNWIKFAVEGNSNRASILTGLRVNIVSRAPLTSKTVLSIEGCGGLVSPRPFVADFSATPPLVRALPGKVEEANGDVVATRPANFPFTVSESDPEVFTLAVGPGPACHCSWTASVDYTQDGQSYTVPIDDHGKPFHAVPTDRLPTYTIVNGKMDDDPVAFPNCHYVRDKTQRWTSLCPMSPDE
ncbi:hypothetical protein JIG36_10110 [Actinoplanes sp. LDG1-06]|uniref:Uncharacterized protein n=1 Tax=Paractinoplanes ovalisporus TaxID=2810368 RepID=A0ABS2A7T8_9ACTN|nr:hypothetical protein [Actinoplanes ovalisporus]MBM2615909.1 hypothetical protein [Actinoplanes ovalisporus]